MTSPHAMAKNQCSASLRPLVCGSAPCARQPRWGVPLRRFVAHRVRSHKEPTGSIDPPPTSLPPPCRSALVRDRGAGVFRSVGWSRTNALLQKPLAIWPATDLRPLVGAHLCATAPPECAAPSVVAHKCAPTEQPTRNDGRCLALEVALDPRGPRMTRRAGGGKPEVRPYGAPDPRGMTRRKSLRRNTHHHANTSKPAHATHARTQAPYPSQNIASPPLVPYLRTTEQAFRLPHSTHPKRPLPWNTVT